MFEHKIFFFDLSYSTVPFPYVYIYKIDNYSLCCNVNTSDKDNKGLWYILLNLYFTSYFRICKFHVRERAILYQYIPNVCVLFIPYLFYFKNAKHPYENIVV